VNGTDAGVEGDESTDGCSRGVSPSHGSTTSHYTTQ